MQGSTRENVDMGVSWKIWVCRYDFTQMGVALQHIAMQALYI